MKWEYLCFKLSDDVADTEAELNEYGRQGWELVCSYAFCNKWLIMKRAKK
jgi:hypothetical protein